MELPSLPFAPPARHRPSALVLGTAAAVLVAAASACSDSDESSGPAKPAGPPSLRIASIEPAGGPRVVPARGADSSTSDCVELGRDDRRTVVVAFSVNKNWTFQAPYGCSDAPQCGLVELTVELLDVASTPGVPKQLVLLTAGPSLSVPLSDLFAGDTSHPVKLSARFLNQDGTPFVPESDAQAPNVTDTVTVDVRPRCTEDAGLPDAALTDAAPLTDATPGDATLDAPDASPPPDATPDAPDASPTLDAAHDAPSRDSTAD